MVICFTFFVSVLLDLVATSFSELVDITATIRQVGAVNSRLPLSEVERGLELGDDGVVACGIPDPQPSVSSTCVMMTPQR